MSTHYLQINLYDLFLTLHLETSYKYMRRNPPPHLLFFIPHVYNYRLLYLELSWNKPEIFVSAA